MLINAGLSLPDFYKVMNSKIITFGWTDILTTLCSKGIVCSEEDLKTALLCNKVDMIPLMIKSGANPYDPKVLQQLFSAPNEIFDMILSLTPNRRINLRDPEVLGLLSEARPHVKESLLFKNDPEFVASIKTISIKIIRALQGDLYKKLETASKLKELEDVLSKQLIAIPVLRDLFYKILPEADGVLKRQSLVDSITKKLTKLLGSSFYFDPEKSILRGEELEEELKDAITIWQLADSQKSSQQKLAS